MTIRETQFHADVYDFAIWSGIWDAAQGKPMSDRFLGSPNTVALECRSLYELGYEMERESDVINGTAIHHERAFARKWDDLHGQGLAEFVANGRYVQVHFDYSVLIPDDLELAPGMAIDIKFQWTADGHRRMLEVRRVHNS